MGYFGGTGAGRGWHQYFFFLLPEQLDTIIHDLSLVLVSGTEIFPDQAQPTKDEFIGSYCAYVQACLHDPNVDGWTSFLQVDFTTSMDVFKLARGRGRRPIDTLQAQEPLVGVQSASILYSGGRLWTNVIDKGCLPFGFGLSYPKVVFFDSDGYVEPHETDNFSNTFLFRELRHRLSLMTRPCRIQSPTQVHRTRFRVAPELVLALNESPMMQSRNLRVV